MLDPLGQMRVSQLVVPLNTARDIDLFGGAPVAGDRRFTVTATLGTTTLPRAAHKAPFAPAQFFEMSDDEKLAAPSFESMEAGCVFGEAGVSFDAAQVIPAPLEYQDVPITLDGPPPVVPSNAAPPPQTVTTAPVADLRAQRCGGPRAGAARRTRALPQRRRARRRDVRAGALGDRADGRGRPACDRSIPTSPRGASTRACSRRMNRARARWQIVPAHEVEE